MSLRAGPAALLAHGDEAEWARLLGASHGAEAGLRAAWSPGPCGEQRCGSSRACVDRDVLSAGRGGYLAPLMRPQKFPDTLGSLEGNTEGPGTGSSEPHKSNLEKKNESCDITLPDFRLCYEATVIKIVCYWHKKI